jgi:hypothetical protein
MKTLNLKVGDITYTSEITPGAGISNNHKVEVIEVCKTDEGDDTYLVKDEMGKYRMVSFQGQWGYAYNYFDEYKLKQLN